jgi:trimeric autotransporter adhesin
LLSHQRAVLNFVVPSGLLDGAYNDGKELDLYANFPAEFIVKRNADGNWCSWNGSSYDSLITGLNGTVRCMVEGPDGKIYVGGNFTNAGGVAAADYLARWNPITAAWEAVVTGTAPHVINKYVFAMAFNASGELFIGGDFTDLGSADGDKIAKINISDGTATALGTGIVGVVYSIVIDSNGVVYAGGVFSGAGGVANTVNIAKWNGTAWSALATGLTGGVGVGVYSLAFSPNGVLYIGGGFTDASYPYLCKWNGTAFSAVGTASDIGNIVFALTFDATGWLYVGGQFTNAGGVPNADYIAKWSGSKWESLGTGTNNAVRNIVVNSGKVYVGGLFTAAGGLTLPDFFNAIYSNGAWQPLDINFPLYGNYWPLVIASDGSLYIGGEFSTTGADPDVNAYTGVVALNLNVSSASANTYPYMQVFGPGTLKAITNYSTGKTISFDGLTLQAGEAISLSFDPLNLQFKGGWAGRGNLMRYVVAGSDYGDFYLMPGNNLLSLFMTGTDSNSHAWIAWTPKFWGIDGALL